MVKRDELPLDKAREVGSIYSFCIDCKYLSHRSNTLTTNGWCRRCSLLEWWMYEPPPLNCPYMNRVQVDWEW